MSTKTETESGFSSSSMPVQALSSFSSLLWNIYGGLADKLDDLGSGNTSLTSVTSSSKMDWAKGRVDSGCAVCQQRCRAISMLHVNQRGGPGEERADMLWSVRACKDKEIGCDQADSQHLRILKALACV